MTTRGYDREEMKEMKGGGIEGRRWRGGQTIREADGASRP
jgi:hypothetical protein